MKDARLLGLETDADKKVAIRSGDYHAMKMAIWRSSRGWSIVERAAAEILAGCAHFEGCPGATVETEPCLRECVDREKRMSALVILNAAKEFAPVDVRKPADGPYFAPSREYFSKIISQLGATQIENDALRAKLGVTTTEPAPPKELVP